MDHPSTLSVYYVTFNCGRELIDQDYWASHFFRGLPKSTPLPGLIVLSLQEIAPLAQSFLGSSLLVPYFSHFVSAINVASAPSTKYRNVVTRNVGMTAIMILQRSDLSPFEPISAAGVGVGHAAMGNKGAVGVRLRVSHPHHSSADLTFVAAHLAPMEHACERRNQDFANIVRGLAFTPMGGKEKGIARTAEEQPLLAQPVSGAGLGTTGMYDAGHLVFFGGDLNYRTSDTGPSPTQHQEFPSPEEYALDAAGNLVESGSFASYRQTDQLTREHNAGMTLHHLAELHRPTFPPTYKYQSGGLDWPSDGAEPKTWQWSKHRFPSWCDRILFSEALHVTPQSPFYGRAYKALPLQPTSDHRPVSLFYELDLASLDAAETPRAPAESPFPLNPRWRQERASARRLEILVGGFAYLATTWEGNTILLALGLGAIGGWYIVQSMVSA